MSAKSSSESENDDVENAKATSQSPPRKKLKKKSNRQRIMTADTSSSDHDAEEIVILSQHKVVESPPAKTSSETNEQATKTSEERRSRPLALCSRDVESSTRNSSNEMNSQSSSDGKSVADLPSRYSQSNLSEKAKHLNSVDSQNTSAGKSGALQACSSTNHSPLTSPENSSTTLGRSTIENMTKRTVLIGATEVHRAVELISELKHRYNMDVVVRSGLNVGYLLSSRLGVHRFHFNQKRSTCKIVDFS